MVKPEALRQYVSGGSDGRLRGMREALSPAIDDVTRDYGDDVYDRMSNDATVAACTNTLKASIIDEGLAFTPAVTNKDQDGYELAVELADYTERTFDSLASSTHSFLWSMLDSLVYGSRIAELIWEDAEVGGRKRLQLRDINPLSRNDISFVVNPSRQVIGFARRSASMFGTTSVDLADIMPREKFAYLTNRPRENDPRGTSVYRPAYKPWWLKQQIPTEYLKYLVQFANPGLAGFTAPESNNIDVLDSLGNVLYSITPEEAMVQSLEDYRNGAVLAFRGGSTIQVISSTGEGRAHLAALDKCEREITTAILGQTLTTMEAEHQSRAASQVHQSVLDTMIRQARSSMVRMIERQVVRPIVAYNYDPKALALMPRLSIRKTDSRDWAAKVTAVAALSKSGYLDPSQYAYIDQELGLPPRIQSVDKSPDTDGLSN